MKYLLEYLVVGLACMLRCILFPLEYEKKEKRTKIRKRPKWEIDCICSVCGSSNTHTHDMPHAKCKSFFMQRIR